jgi:YD repeat-containing protein
MSRLPCPFPYDANGNTLAKVDSSGTTTYGCDFETQLTSLVLPGAGRIGKSKFMFRGS